MELPKPLQDLLDDGLSPYKAELFKHGFEKGFQYLYEGLLKMDFHSVAVNKAQNWFEDEIVPNIPTDKLYNCELSYEEDGIKVSYMINEEYARMFWDKVADYEKDFKSLFG